MLTRTSLQIRSLVSGADGQLVKAGTAMIVSGLGGSLLGFGYWVIAARLFTVDDVGFGSAIIASMTLVASLSNLGLNFVGSRFLPVAGTKRRALAGRIHISTGLLGVVGGSLFLLWALTQQSDLGRVGIWFVVATAVWTIFNVQDHVLLGLGRSSWIPIINGIFGATKLLGLIVLWLIVRESSWQAVVWPWFGAAAIGVVGTLVFVERISKDGDSTSQLTPSIPNHRELARFALANHVGSLLLQLAALVYPILVLHLLGREQTAYFYTGWMIANLLMLTGSSISSALVAHAANPMADVRALMVAGLRYALLLVVPGAVGLLLAGKYVLLAFGADYQASYHFVAILALGCPVFVVNTLFAGLMRVRQALAPVVLQGFTAAVVALTLAFVLGPTLGLSGFAISYDISQVCALVIVFVVTVRRRSDRHISSLTGQPTAG